MNSNWRKSTYSGGDGGNCVEVGQGTAVVRVRDTKQAGTGPVLLFSADAWQEFVSTAK